MVNKNKSKKMRALTGLGKYVFFAVFICIVTSCQHSKNNINENSDEEFILIINEKQNKLEIQNKESGNSFVINDESGRFSNPQISPNKENIAFIYPFEFEELGYVYIYNVNSNEKREVNLISLLYGTDDYVDKTPFELVWLNEALLLVKLGHGHGTIGYSNEIFYFNIENNDSGKLLTTCDFIEKINISNNMLEIILIREDDVIKDVERNEAARATTVIDCSEIYQLINNGEILELELDF